MRRIILSVIAVIVLAYAARELLYYGARQNKIGEYNKLNTMFLDSNRYEAIFIGSSRAESHFNPHIIDSITGLNSYNCGLEGATMPFIYSALKAYLVHSEPPRYAILNMDYYVQKENYDRVHRFPRYFPYLSNHELYKGLEERDCRFPYFRWIAFYSMTYYNQKYLNASVRGLTGYQSDFDQGYVQGYAPLPPGPQIMLDTADYSPYTASPAPIFYQSLDSLIQLCKQKNIQLIFACSPLYYRKLNALQNRKELLDRIGQVARANDIPFIDQNFDEIASQKELFNDPYHLNRYGSRLFSLKFAVALEQYLDE